MTNVLRHPRHLALRLGHALTSAAERGDFTALLLALVLLLSPALALLASGWTLDPLMLIGTATLGVLVNSLLARSRYDDLFAFLASGLLGALSVWLLSALSLRANLLAALGQVAERLATWLLDAFTGGINQDDLAFSVLVGGLFWVLAYNTAWHIFRLERSWRAALPSGLLLVLAVALYSGTESLDIYVIAFALALLLLFVRSSLDARQWDWYSSGMRIPRKLRQQVVQAGAVLAVLVVTIAWVIPSADLRQRLDAFQEFLRSDPVQALAELASRLLTPLEGDGPATTDYYGGDSLSLGGAIRLGDQPIFLVEAPRSERYFWRARVFERYDNGRWVPSATWRVTDGGAPLDIVLSAELVGGERVSVDQTFTIMNGGLRLFHAAALPYRFDQSGRIDLTRIDETQGDTSPMNVSVVRPLRVIERGTTYTASSLVSRATPEQLRTANGPDPAWVSNPNALLGTAISPRIIDLAKQIVADANATTRYDSAKAIETWLRSNIIYEEAIPAPPQGADPIDWFLFEERRGYCTYYATAMVVMLRSLGIPARLVAGFAEGEWDEEVQRYVVRERDAHTWVEVYFPGFGWIEFEPTAAQRPLNQEEQLPSPDQSQSPGQPSATPTPSPSPTPLPSPTYTPLPAASSTPPDGSAEETATSETPPELPTMTFTPTPTPTPTAVIVPTEPPPLQPPPPPPDNNFLAFLLRALGAALVLFLLVVVVLLLLGLTWWWWEWRGLGGMSPISRSFARLERYVPLIGVLPRPQQTPEEKRQEIVAQLPIAERPVSAITRAYSAERYGAPSDAPAAESSEQAWNATRAHILRRWARRFNPFRRGDD